MKFFATIVFLIFSGLLLKGQVKDSTIGNMIHGKPNAAMSQMQNVPEPGAIT